MEDMTPSLISASATVIVALSIYGVNLVRAAHQVHAEQLLSIAKIERERDEAKSHVARDKELAEKRERVGSKLVEFHAAGRELYQQIFRSDDSITAEEWAEKIREYRQDLMAFISTEISPAKAMSVDAVPHSFLAVEMIGMSSNATSAPRTGLLQKLEHRLQKLVVLMGEY